MRIFFYIKPNECQVTPEQLWLSAVLDHFDVAGHELSTARSNHTLSLRAEGNGAGNGRSEQ